MNNIMLLSNHHEHEHEHLHAGHSHGFFGEWVESLVEHLPVSEKTHELINHIIVDSINVFVLLFAVMMVVFLLTSYINLDKLHAKLSSLKSIWGFALAIALGGLSPFCSCTIIPVLMGFLSVGVPVSVCLCYLTASSMINLTAIISLSSTTDFSFTLVYIICALVIIMVSSAIFSMIKLDSSVGSYHEHHHDTKDNSSLKARIKSAFLCTLNVFKRSAIYILLGVTLSSVIMTYYSIDSLANIVNENSAISTLLVSIIGIPIHSDIFSIVPIINLLKVLSPSVAMTFVLSTMVISLPSVIILTRAIKAKTVLFYCGVLIGLTIIVGFSVGLFI